MNELRIFTIIKKLQICFNVYRLLHTNNLNPFFEEITVSLNKTIIRYQLEDFSIGMGRLIKNDKSTTGLSTELTGLCNQHKLIATNGALTLFKCHTRYGKLHRTTKNIRSFLVSSTNHFFCWNSEKNGEGLAGEFFSYIAFYPTLQKSRIEKYAADNQDYPTSLFFNQHQTRYIKRVYQNHNKRFALMYRKIEIRIEIYGTS